MKSDGGKAKITRDPRIVQSFKDKRYKTYLLIK